MKLLLFISLLTLPTMLLGQEVIPPADYVKKIESSKEPQLIDVRTPDEYKEGHIKDFVNIDFFGSDFETQIKELDKGKPIFLYCRSGNRSQQSQELLIKLGHKDVTDLKGGIDAWMEAGYELEK